MRRKTWMLLLLLLALTGCSEDAVNEPPPEAKPALLPEIRSLRTAGIPARMAAMRMTVRVMAAEIRAFSMVYPILFRGLV